MGKQQTELTNLRSEINTMGTRISTLVDELRTLQRDVQRFKSKVAKDITTLESMNRGEL